MSKESPLRFFGDQSPKSYTDNHVEPNHKLQFMITARSILRKSIPSFNQDLLIAISDSTGQIKSVVNHPEGCPVPSLLVKGACWASASIGHNGLGSAILARKPVVVVGTEHRLSNLQECFTLGFPVIRDDDGLIGGILVAGLSQSYDPTIIAWVDNQVKLINQRLSSDKSARSMANSMLLEENMRLVAASEETPVLGVAIVGMHGQIIEVNSAASTIINKAQGELLQSTESTLDKQLLDLVENCLQTRSTCFAEITAELTGNGSPVFVNCQPLIDTAHDSSIAAMMVFYDPGRTLQRSVATHQALSHIEDDVVILDRTGRIVFGNRFRSHDLGRHYLDVVFNGQKYRPDGEHISLLIQALETGQDTISKIYQTPDGTRTRKTDIRLLKDPSNHIVGVVGIRKDITEEQQLKKQLMYSERLSTIGELAAQTIHELRNPLAAMRASAQLGLCLDEAEKDAILSKIISEIDKLNDFVSNILLLAKPEKASYKPENLGEIVDSLLSLVKAKTVLSGVTIVQHYNKDALQPIRANAKLLEQALLNVVNNAIDVMKDGGTLTLTILDHPQHNTQELIIADTGTGITPEQMENLFKPFFTTKGDGGTGLGLAITKRIIAENHGGRIWIESEFGRGTQVHIELVIIDRSM